MNPGPQSENRNAIRLAEALRAKIPSLIDDWETRARASIPEAQGKSSRKFVDSLPDFLEALAKTLETPDSERQWSHDRAIGGHHGEIRAQDGDYPLGQLVYEYQILREVLLTSFEGEPALDTEGRCVFHRVIDLGIQESVVRFTEITENLVAAARAEEKRALELLERQRTELRETEKRLFQAVEVAGIGFYDWDMVRDHVNYSERMQKTWGMISEGPISLAMQKIHPEDRERVENDIQHAIAGRSPFRAQYRIVVEGQIRWIEAVGEISYIDEQPVRFFGTAIDISKQKQSEYAVQAERHKLRAIFSDSPAAMALWRGPENVFELVNPEYQKIFGERRLEGKPILEALPELAEQQFPQLLESVFESGEPFVGHEVRALIRRTDGGPLEERFYDFTYVRVVDPEGQPYGVFDHAIDVTERVLAKKTIEESELQLKGTVSDLHRERLLREKFVATLTHDLRSPLTSARMSAQMLARGQSLNSVSEKQVERITRSIDRVDKLIQSLLDVSRIQAGEMLKLQLNECHLDELVARVAKEMGLIYGPRFVVRSEGPVIGIWDCEGLQRLIENLASNAAKYGRDGGPVTIELRRQDQLTILSVHNEGAPIGREECAILFEPFKRTESAEDGLQRGWGLGLTLVRAMAEAHGGTVDVESSREEGTTFSVLLPRDSRRAAGADGS